MGATQRIAKARKGSKMIEDLQALPLLTEAGKNAIDDIVELANNDVFRNMSSAILKTCIKKRTNRPVPEDPLLEELGEILQQASKTPSPAPDLPSPPSATTTSNDATAFLKCQNFFQVAGELTDVMTDEEWAKHRISLFRRGFQLATSANSAMEGEGPKDKEIFKEGINKLGNVNCDELCLHNVDAVASVFCHTAELKDLQKLGLKLFYFFRPAPKEEQIRLSLLDTCSGLFGDRDPITGKKPLVDAFVEGFAQPSEDMNILKDRLFQGGRRGVTLVVGGESGSGKTIFSTFAVAPGVPRLYIDLKAERMTEPPKLSTGFQEWVKLLRWLAIRADSKSMTTLANFLHDLCRILNAERNNWAVELIKRRIRGISTLAGEWFLGQRSREVKIERCALVVDESSRSMELVHGLIDSLETIAQLCPAKAVALILCGTSLEMLHKCEDRSFSVGSNPASSVVVTLKAPNIDSLLSRYSIASFTSPMALKGGVYTKSFLTNARIVSKAVLPYFCSFYGHQNEQNQEKRDALQVILGSSWECMSFVPSAFLEYNRIRDLPRDDKEDCIAAAFRYLVSENVNLVGSTKLLEEMAELHESDKTTTKENFGGLTMMDYLFRVGLVTQEVGLTSTALRLLICKGLAAPVIQGNGHSLELAVSMTLCRQLQTCGYVTVMYTLKGAWPPWCLSVDEYEWTENLTNQHDEDVEHIKNYFAGEGKRALVLVQGVSNAQGPDNIVLRRSDTTLLADFYQDKNVQDPENVDVWTRSLGVGNSNETNFMVVDYKKEEHEGKESAFYSASGMSRFCNAVGAEAGDWVLVWVSKKSDGNFTLKDNLENGIAKLWTKNHLEPAWSALGCEEDVES